MRLVVVAAACTMVLLAVHAHVARVQARWGGPPRRALIAVDDASVGARPELRAVLLPPAMVPRDAPQSLEPDVRLALALPAGAVLTRTHVSPRGPAVGLDPHLRVVPLPVESGLDITPGGRVDVWVLAAAPGRAQRVARRRPVVGVADDDADQPTALVGLATHEVAAALRGLAEGQVLLTQAPP
ncbi:MAG: hypothetical protein KY460_15045 [Actinobacteria bacterium]|nr:hypothetical protein [Actinomycetota bacterium]